MSAQFDRRSGFEPPEENLPPLQDWPPPEIVARWEARKEAARRRKTLRRRVVAWMVVAAVVVAGGVFVLKRTTGSSRAPKVVAPAPRPATVVWGVNTATASFVAVVANPGDLGAVAIAIPEETLVDVPGGPSTIGDSAGDTGLLLAATQATLDRRVDHYLVMNDVELSSLVDRIGPIEVQVDEPFEWSGRVFGPGSERLTGGPTVAYLDAGTDLDRTSRWEEVLTGIFLLEPNARRWSGPLGASDSEAAVRTVLLKANKAAVLELPTAPSEGGGLLADHDDVVDFANTHLGASGTPLVRVVVLSANGRKGDAIVIATRLAGLGYRVVAAQQNRTRLRLTQIVASNDSFLGKAAQVQAILGVGSVYVEPETSGVADVTIVVGRDFKPA